MGFQGVAPVPSSQCPIWEGRRWGTESGYSILQPLGTCQNMQSGHLRASVSPPHTMGVLMIVIRTSLLSEAQTSQTLSPDVWCGVR